MATRKQSIYPYLLVAPALLLVLCVVFFPVMKAIIMSFQTYDLRRPNSIAFCGLGNYIKAFNDALFWNSLFKTVLWVAFGESAFSRERFCKSNQFNSMGYTWCTDWINVEMDV